MTAGDIGLTAQEQRADLTHAELTHLDKPGGDTDVAHPWADEGHSAVLDGPLQLLFVSVAVLRAVVAASGAGVVVAARSRARTEQDESEQPKHERWSIAYTSVDSS